MGKEELSAIVDILLRDVKKRLVDKKMQLEISPAARAVLVEKGTDFKFGARPLKRAIQKLVEDEIAERLLKKVFRAGDTIYIRKTEGKLEFLKKEEKARTERTAPADTKTEPETGRERAAHGKASEE